MAIYTTGSNSLKSLVFVLDYIHIGYLMKIIVSANQFITGNKKSLSIKDGLKYCLINTLILLMCLVTDTQTII